MNTMNEVPPGSGWRRDARWNGGVILIMVGTLALAGELAPASMIGWVFSGFGLVLLALGGLRRTRGLVIPGGIVTGIGLGIALLEGPFAGASEDQQGAVFLLAFGASWGLITLVWALAAHEFCWWPLIPGSVLLLTGVLLLAGDPGRQGLIWLNTIWPLVLIATGVYLLVRRHERLPQ